MELEMEFFNNSLPQALTLLVAKRRLQAVIRNLNTLLSGDKEFKFMVNYYLRKNAYKDDPFEKLQKKINQFFAEQAKVNKNG